jgi:hypothetical protein
MSGLTPSVKNMTEALRRIPTPLRPPACVHWLTVAPLLEPLDLRPWLGHGSVGSLLAARLGMPATWSRTGRVVDQCQDQRAVEAEGGACRPDGRGVSGGLIGYGLSHRHYHLARERESQMAAKAPAKSAGSPSDGKPRSSVPPHPSRTRERGAATSRPRVTAANARAKPRDRSLLGDPDRRSPVAYAKFEPVEYPDKASWQSPSPAKFALCLGTVPVSTCRELRVSLPASTGRIVTTSWMDGFTCLLGLCRCARKHSGNTLWVDIEGQEGEWLTARISPLMHEVERLVDQ